MGAAGRRTRPTRPCEAPILDTERTPAGLWSRRNHPLLLWLAVTLYVANVLAQNLLLEWTQNLYATIGLADLLTIVLPLALLARRGGAGLAVEFHLRSCRPDLILWAGLAALAAALPANALNELSSRLSRIQKDPELEALSRLPQETAGIALAALSVLVVAPVAEELFFRGVIHRLARRHWGLPPALVISSLVFAIAHVQPADLFGLIVIGLLLGFVYEATGSVTACVVGHAVYNALAFTVILAAERGVPLQLVLPPVPLLAISCLVLLYILRRLWIGGIRADAALHRRDRHGGGFPPGWPGD